MHHVHNAASKATGMFGGMIEEILDEIFIFLRYAKQAKNFEKAQELLDLTPLKFKRRIECRWLQIVDVVKRFIALFEPLKTFFSGLPSKEQKKPRVMTIRSFLDSPISLAYLYFLVFSLEPLDKFEKFFQTSEPVIHKLHDSVISLVADVCQCFLQQERIESVKRLDEFSEIPDTYQLEDKEILIGKKARDAMSNVNITTAQRTKFYSKVRSFYKELLRAFLHYLPLSNRFLRSAQMIDPLKLTEIKEEDLLYMHSQLKLTSDRDALLLQWRKLCADSNELVSRDIDLCEFWKAVKASEKYVVVIRLVERLFVVPHSNASTERIFSLVKNVLKPERGSLIDKNLNGLITVKSFLNSRSLSSATLPVTRDLQRHVESSRMRYRKYLDDEREREKREREEEEKREDERKVDSIKKQRTDDAARKRKLAQEYMDVAKKLLKDADDLQLPC